MAATDFDDIEVLDDDTDDDYARLRKTHLKDLRDAAKEAPKLRKELDGIKRRDAISTAGLGELNKDQTEALATLVTDPTPENLRQKAEALGWVQPEPEPDTPTDAEIEGHGEIAAAANGARPPAKSTITAEDYSQWDQAKRMRFTQEHPLLVQSLRAGQAEVPLPNGFM